MADEGLRPIIVKRVRKVGGKGHGGTWKIAYADFVTAMMAFFLLMWLLGVSSQGDLQGIAEYFNTPLRVAMGGGKGSGDSSSVIQGGGKDLTRKDGQVRKGEDPSYPPPQNLRSTHSRGLEAELERRELARLLMLKGDIEQLIESRPVLRQFKDQLLLDITTEGLRIQIVDEQNRPMFALASAELQPYTRDILLEIGQLLNDVPNKISLSGHTDAKPYASGERKYSNWELSADRANASRRALVAGGMEETKIARVVGLSSAVPYDPTDPFNPINRRISITVMNKKTEEAASRDPERVDVSEAVQGAESAQEEQVEEGVPAAAGTATN